MIMILLQIMIMIIIGVTLEHGLRGAGVRAVGIPEVENPGSRNSGTPRCLGCPRGRFHPVHFKLGRLEIPENQLHDCFTC